MRDYGELVKALQLCPNTCRGCPRLNTSEPFTECKAKLNRDAADAIEELNKALDAVNDAHNEGYDVGYWAARRDYEPRWISVEERLPHYLDHVLCVNKYGIQMVGYLTDYKEGGFRCESGMDSCDYITHWMPLPDPPKEVE